MFASAIMHKFINTSKPKQTVLSDDDWLKGLSRANDDDPLNLSGVFQCIMMISGTMSKLPFFVMDGETKKHVDDAALYEVLNVSPNSRMTAATYKQLMYTWLLTKGEAYAIPERGRYDNKLRALIPVYPGFVSKRFDGEKLIYQVTLPNRETKLFRPDEIIHRKYFSLNGIDGISPLQYAQLTLGVGLRQEKFQESLYRNNARPGGVLETPADISDIEKEVRINGKKTTMSGKDIVRYEWNKHHQGADNAFNVAVLDNGMKYSTIEQISPADLDFVNSKTINLEDIARFFSVPAYKLGVGKSTYSNNEQAAIDYICSTIIPMITQDEQEYTLKILTKEQRNKNLYIKINVEAELRGDTATRANWYNIMQQTGVYDIDEIRELENRPELPDGKGKVRLVGPNKTPLDLLINGATPAEATPNPITEKR